MGDYWSEWAQRGEDWVNVFKVIDPVISAFAKEHEMTVMPWHWDEPSRVLVWSSGGFNRSIRLLIEQQNPSYALKASGSIWKDAKYEDELVRSWHYKDFGAIAFFVVEDHAVTAVTQAPQRRDFYSSLKSIFDDISSWAEAENQTKLGKASELRYLP